MAKHKRWILPALVAFSLAGCSDDSQAPPARDKGVAEARASEGGVTDRGPATDQKQPQPEAAAGGCASGYAGCSSFTDGTTGAQTVTFPNFDYTPKCLKVKVGQAVTFSGSFTAHPLEQACGPAAAIAATSSGSSTSVSFSKPGLYGYYCTLHGTASGTGMAGAIEVVP